MKISMDGRLCDEREAVVSVYDHGFLYGVGLFETFRTYNGVPFLLREHLERLAQGCRHLHMDYQVDEQRILHLVSLLLEANELKDGYFRLSISAGVDVLGLPTSDSYAHPTEIVYVKTLPIPDPVLLKKGRLLQLLSLRRNSPEGHLREKSFHYLNNILGKRELSSYAWAEGAEGLFLNEAGNLTEGIVSNLFFVRNGICYTPEVETGILPGITRSYVIKLAKQLGFTVEEGRYTPDQLFTADEVFLTNSIQGIVPVSVIFDPMGNRYPISDKQLTQQCIDQYGK